MLSPPLKLHCWTEGRRPARWDPPFHGFRAHGTVQPLEGRSFWITAFDMKKETHRGSPRSKDVVPFLSIDPGTVFSLCNSFQPLPVNPQTKRPTVCWSFRSHELFGKKHATLRPCVRSPSRSSAMQQPGCL